MKLCICFGYVNKIMSLKFTPVCFSSSYFIDGMTKSRFKNFLLLFLVVNMLGVVLCPPQTGGDIFILVLSSSASSV